MIMYCIINLDILFPLSVDVPAAPRNLKTSIIRKKANTQNIIKRMYAIVQMSSMQNVITCIYLINHG